MGTPDVNTKQTLKFFAQADDTMQQRMQNVSGATGRDIETTHLKMKMRCDSFSPVLDSRSKNILGQMFLKICLR